jgi:hypothetical protein
MRTSHSFFLSYELKFLLLCSMSVCTVSFVPTYLNGLNVPVAHLNLMLIIHQDSFRSFVCCGWLMAKSKSPAFPLVNSLLVWAGSFFSCFFHFHFISSGQTCRTLSLILVHFILFILFVNSLSEEMSMEYIV